MTIAERFWSKVDKSSGPDGCWLWKAATTKGYGQFHLARRIVYAHRLAFELAKGPIPDGLDVLHSCDNHPCCNPAHLWAGTQLDNMQDCAAKGRCAAHVHPECLARGDRHGSHTHPERVARGEMQGSAKLTEDKVLEIRRLFSEGHNKHEMARLMSVARSTIRSVVRGETWKHVKGYQNDG